MKTTHQITITIGYDFSSTEGFGVAEISHKLEGVNAGTPLDVIEAACHALHQAIPLEVRHANGIESLKFTNEPSIIERNPERFRCSVKRAA